MRLQCDVNSLLLCGKKTTFQATNSYLEKETVYKKQFMTVLMGYNKKVQNYIFTFHIILNKVPQAVLSSLQHFRHSVTYNGSFDEHWEELYTQSPYYTNGIRMVSDQCGTVYVLQELSVVWMTFHMFHTCMDALLCVCAGEVSSCNAYWRPCHTHHIHLASHLCGYDDEIW
jgi:hypothetical protein